jgi:dTDP-glucose 4,6-dehydratase
VDGLFRFATLDPSRDGRSADCIVNLGNPEEVTILQLAQEVIRATNSSSAVVFTPLPEDDPKVRRPDISRARRVLGWRPTVSLVEGLRLAIPYFSATLARV